MDEPTASKTCHQMAHLQGLFCKVLASRCLGQHISIDSAEVVGYTVHVLPHVVLLGLAQCKSGLTNWAFSGEAQSALEGSTCAVYPAH